MKFAIIIFDCTVKENISYMCRFLTSFSYLVKKTLPSKKQIEFAKLFQLPEDICEIRLSL